MDWRYGYWLLVGTTGFVYLFIAVWSLPYLTGLTDGIRPFDMRMFGYSGEEARALLAVLDAEAEGFYINVHHFLDALYAPLFALSLCIGFWYLTPAWPLPLRVLLMVPPVLAGLADVMENASVTWLMRMDDPPTDEMVAIASRWTVLKTVFTALSWLSLVGLGTLEIRKSIAGRRRY